MGVPDWVGRVMDKCRAQVNPPNRGAFCVDVSLCFYDSIGELSKANLSARQSVIALWPAIVSSITAINPDPSDLAYDNLLWALLFAATSGGTKGFSTEKPKRYLSAANDIIGRQLCLESDTSREKKRFQGHGFHVLTHGALALSLGFYFAFLGVYLKILESTVLTWACSPYWLGSLWYWLSGVPALLQAIHRLLFNNVTLFEETAEPEDQHTKRPNSAIPMLTAGAVDLPQTRFVECTPRNSIRLWTRILENQLTNRPYRLLVKGGADTAWNGFFELCVGAVRLTVFILGSVTQSSLIVMPTPFDTLLLTLISFATFVPRAFWVSRWLKTSDGADRVVFVPNEGHGYEI
ncbi:MAG: hypothetical protein M1813_009790 [Trichoglossum hirsutum]|nr:MAG: hypothetical protein M1813_009790 [Trichoglossum hirsutum]